MQKPPALFLAQLLAVCTLLAAVSPAWGGVVILRPSKEFHCSIGISIYVDSEQREGDARKAAAGLGAASQGVLEHTGDSPQPMRDLQAAFCTAEALAGLDVDELFMPAQKASLALALDRLVLARSQDGRNPGIEDDIWTGSVGLILYFTSGQPDDPEIRRIRERAIRAKLQLSIDSDRALFAQTLESLANEISAREDHRDVDPIHLLREILRVSEPITIEQIERANAPAIQRMLYASTARFPGPSQNQPTRCLGHSATGHVRGLTIGVSEVADSRLPKLPGATNDAALLSKTLALRSEESIQMLVGTDATRSAIMDALYRLVDQTQCGDVFVVHFSGHALPIDLCPEQDRRCTLTGWRVALVPADFQGNDVDVTWRVDPGAGAIFAADLSEFITAIRNRGASITLTLDTSYAAGLDLFALQDLALHESNTRSGRITTAQLGDSPLAHHSWVTPLLPNPGTYAAFYAADFESEAHEWDIATGGDKARYGVFSYAFSRAIQTTENPTIGSLFSAISAEYAAMDRPKRGATPILDTSDAGALVFPAKSSNDSSTLQLQILDPPETRGAIAVPDPRFAIIGRLTNPGTVAVLTADYKPISIAANGQFRHEVELSPGQRAIHFAAFDYDSNFRTRTVTVQLPDELEPLAERGKRYALIIANQNYDHYRPLSTPHADATSIVTLLQERFGFETRLRGANGESIDLLLYDATGPQILRMLELLQNRLTDSDTLIIYYAGHGYYLKQIDRAYWLGVDANPEEKWTWISSSQLNDDLAMFSARNILVVADSCYAGGMAQRNVPALHDLDEDRRKALFKAATRRSRVLITSGGTEPVLDGGGEGHSVFALALITGLEQMDKDVFSSEELYSAFIYPMVHGKVQQEPRHKELTQSGHEGGDVVFFRVKDRTE